MTSHVDTSVLTPAARRLVAMARLTGWTLSQNNRRTLVALRSPDGTHQVNVPAGSINANRLKSVAGQVIRNTPIEALHSLVDGHDDLVRDPDAAEAVATFGVDLADFLAKEEAARSEEEAARARPPLGVPGDPQHVCPECGEPQPSTLRLGAHRRRAHGVVGTSPDAERKRAKTAQRMAQAQATEARSGLGDVIERHPRPARRGGKPSGKGKMYESAWVDVLTLADGSTTFGCRACAYRNTNPDSVARHAGRMHATGQTRPPGWVVTDYQPSGRTHASPALANRITNALRAVEGWAQMAPEELGAALAEHLASHGGEPTPAEPLTDEQIVARITALLDRGQYAALNKAVADLTERVTNLSAEAIIAKDRLRQSEAEATRLREEREALRSLLAE